MLRQEKAFVGSGDDRDLAVMYRPEDAEAGGFDGGVGGGGDSSFGGGEDPEGAEGDLEGAEEADLDTGGGDDETIS